MDNRPGHAHNLERFSFGLRTPHTHPTRQREECLGTLAGASGECKAGAAAMWGSLYRVAGVQRIRTGSESGVQRIQSRSSWVNRSRRSAVGRSGRARGLGGLDPGSLVR
jgi:hypothetical protein